MKERTKNGTSSVIGDLLHQLEPEDEEHQRRNHAHKRRHFAHPKTDQPSTKHDSVPSTVRPSN